MKADKAFMKALLLLFITSTSLAKEIEFKGYKARILEESEKRMTLTFIRDAKTDALVKKTDKDLCKLMGRKWKKGQVSYTEVYHTDTNTELPVKDYETFNILECLK
jgi:hypothetical protein